MKTVREPILCYVTDRTGFAAAPSRSVRSLSESIAIESRSLKKSIREAVSARIPWIQIREKDLDARSLLDLARFAVGEARATGSRVLVNDRLDVALAAGAGGVHMGEKSIPVKIVAEWRRSARLADFLIGASCHSVESSREAQEGGADYIFFGPVFATPSKASFGPPQGIAALREVCASVETPVLAIGGVNADNAPSCFEAGAAGVAAIRMFQDAENVEELVTRLKKLKP